VLNTTLANNGGWTLTHALAAGSPAIDAGDNCVFTNTCSPALGFALLTDQRGATRKSGTAVDIGAVEIAPFVTNTPAGTALNNALAIRAMAACDRKLRMPEQARRSFSTPRISTSRAPLV
jgi:hypothetical protein